MVDKIQSIDIKELSGAMAQICDEKGLGNEKVLEIVEDALAAAYKKDYGQKGQIIKAKFNPKKQTVVFSQVKEVVDETTRLPEKIGDSPIKHEVAQPESEEETLPYFNKERDVYLKDAKKTKKDIKVGDEVTIKLKAETKFGRVAAQNAKQVIIQKLREAEKEILYEEFKNKEGKVITATVQQVEGRNVHLDLGKMVGILFPSEQVPTENYRVGQKIKVYVEKVDKETRDTAITLSRSNPDLVNQLFTLEVPEIFTGTVTIESIAREPGSRSKIAIKSKEEGIDPIGSCVGQKGIRVQAVIDELGGEKIDIIEYNKDPKVFITHALSPAKIKYVEIKEEKEKKATVYVDADQLSLAIGKRGQNVRLAAKLTGWKIDIADQEEQEKEAGKEDKKVKQTEDKKEKESTPKKPVEKKVKETEEEKSTGKKKVDKKLKVDKKAKNSKAKKSTKNKQPEKSEDENEVKNKATE